MFQGIECFPEYKDKNPQVLFVIHSPQKIEEVIPRILLRPDSDLINSTYSQESVLKIALSVALKDKVEREEPIDWINPAAAGKSLAESR